MTKLALAPRCSLQGIVVIVGAGRSGTTMIREALAAHPDLAACEYEQNYLWRHGNAHLIHDGLDPDRHGAGRHAPHIRSRLLDLLRESGKRRLVEKTVANVLRLPYVRAVLPEARFLHVIRDGRAVTASAMQRWRATPPARYLASKVRTIPWPDVPRVALRYVANRLKAVLRRRDYAQSWGPRWPGIDEDVQRLSLPELCAKQWMVCVGAARDASLSLPKDSYLEVRYEQLVTDPVWSFEQIAEFVEIDPFAELFRLHVESRIRSSSLEKWKSQIPPEDLARISRQVGPFLRKMGYDG